MGGNSTVVLGGVEIDPSDMSTWGWKNVAVFWAALVAGQELMHYLIMLLENVTDARIPESGKFLQKLSTKDYIFVYINRLSVPFMMFALIRTVWLGGISGHVEWDMAKMTPLNTVGSLVGLFLLYDVFYVPFHWFLHLRGIYKYIHKHHHAQCAPARGNLDASNTHPVEFILGEFLHVVSVYLVPCHIVAVAVFIIGGGLLASLNHTRLDIRIPGFYDVRAHDKHHHMPQSNYGQYTMFMDRLFGSFQPSANQVVYVDKMAKKLHSS